MDSWAKMGLDLHLERTPGARLRADLEHALRSAVRSGRLRPGSRLPSSRQLAADLGVARNTVADVYTQLVAEGYLTSRRGAGTHVAAHPPAASGPVVPGTPDAAEPAPIRHDLRPGRPDLSIFPHAAWLAGTRRVLHAAPRTALGYGDPRGPLSARRTLAAYLGRVRGVDADPARIVLCTGFRQAVALLAGVLAARGVRVAAVESPGLPEVTAAMTRQGLATVPVPVDSGGARTDLLGGLSAGVAVLTPAHQFPTGAQLAPHRRAAVLDWARRTGGFVVEDDYDGEFRYDRPPLGALQGLAPDRVVYVGSAGKTLAPGLRLGWMVVPPELADAVVGEKDLADRHSGVLDQLVLADLIDRGDYDRHVRRARLHYRRRRDRLAGALARLSPPLRATGVAAGLHAVVPLPEADEAEALAHLGRAGVAVNGMRRYTGDAWSPAALVVGYASPAGHAWPGALEALTAALRTFGG